MTSRRSTACRGTFFPEPRRQWRDTESAAEGLAAITAHDPGFSQEAFLEQAQRTFFIVQQAWTQRQPGMSRQVMADGLWQQHRTQIQGYIDAHKRNVLEDLAVGRPDHHRRPPRPELRHHHGAGGGRLRRLRRRRRKRAGHPGQQARRPVG